MTDLDLMPNLDLTPIKRRWSTYSGMGNDRSEEDYDDAGCRILARHAFVDVAALVLEIEQLRDQLARATLPGMCGAVSPTIYTSPGAAMSEVCVLTHGHPGWHQADGDLPMRWSVAAGEAPR